MKIFQCLTTYFSIAAMLLIPSFTQADIVLEVSDNGSDLTFAWTGSMDVGAGTNGSNGVVGDSARLTEPANYRLFSMDGTGFGRNEVGNTSMTPLLTFELDQATNGVGTGFGFINGSLMWDDSFGLNPGVVSPDRTWTFAGQTISSTFGTSLDSGPVVLWTHGTTGETISIGFAPVPEPSMVGLIGMGIVGCVIRRRRR